MKKLKVKKIAMIGKHLYLELPIEWTSRNNLSPGDTVYVVDSNGELRIIPLPSQGRTK
ncbi:MAG: AbrB/MazE/SpoVT family DNA-binding domain-containing protein [Fervidicoccaceae archaeon]